MWIDTTPANWDTWNWITGQEGKLELHCHCGQEATWVLVFGCEENQHIWQEHLCRKCLTKRTAVNQTHLIANRVYNAIEPWTCINADIHDPVTGEITRQVRCQITRWYARELTPDMVTRIKQQTLEEMRKQNQQTQGARTPNYDT